MIWKFNSEISELLEKGWTVAFLQCVPDSYVAVLNPPNKKGN